MATSDTNLADRSGNLLESHKGYDPRIVLFYGIIALLLLILIGGLAYQQLVQTDTYAERERKQNQRRILIPGPRGNIYDRHGTLLVGNDHNFSVLLHLDELRKEFEREVVRIRKNFTDSEGKKEVPTSDQLRQLARRSVVQRYLDRVNVILRRTEKVDAKDLERHFRAHLLLPYKLLDKLSSEEFSRLIEQLPVNSPLEVFASHVRTYPQGAAAAHTLGYVRPTTEIVADDFDGDDLTTFKAEGVSGIAGLEKQFNEYLTGEPGGRIYRVDPRGYRINQPLQERKPKQGNHLFTSLDIELQAIAEEQIGDQRGAAVAIDVATGEVLVLASMPNYNLQDFSPRATQATVDKMNELNVWENQAINGFWPPGSTFKILTSIAGLRAGVLDPDHPITTCAGAIRVGGRLFVCDNQRGHHGEVLLREAIARSCDIYYYEAGKRMTDLVLAAEARRFHLDRATGIELPKQQDRMIVPDRDWKARERQEQGPWGVGDTYNTSIGQGFLLTTPLQMACFAASVARNEVWTQPTLVHRPDAPRQKHPSIGLTPEQRTALIEGMIGTVEYGTAGPMLGPRGPMRVSGVTIAGKTGTAQIPGKRNAGWFICFAPADDPQIAMAVMIEGDTAGETVGGGMFAAPIAASVLKKYFEKKAGIGPLRVAPLKTE